MSNKAEAGFLVRLCLKLPRRNESLPLA